MKIMEQIFLTVLNMSAAACVVLSFAIAAVLTVLTVCLLIRSIKAQPPHLPEPTLQEAKRSQ